MVCADSLGSIPRRRESHDLLNRHSGAAQSAEPGIQRL